MPKVRVEVDLSDEHYRSLVGEAERRRVTVRSLVEQMTQALIRELEEDERDGTDHPILTS